MLPQRKKPGVDVIKDVLIALQEAIPHSEFVSSLSHQYEERGNLSRKQLQGLLSKAKKVSIISTGKLATLEAIINKMHVRDKTAVSVTASVFLKDEHVGELITTILSVFPHHKRVLFLQAKYENNEIIIPAEISELEKFQKIALKK